MSGIRSTGRMGSSIVPNWRWEDPDLDSYELRIAGWLASNTQGFTDEYVTRNRIAKKTGISQGKVSTSVGKLIALGIVSVETIDIDQSKGGSRWVVTVHFDVWDSPQPRSPDDQGPVTTRPGPGHVVTATTGNPLEKTTPSNTCSSTSLTSVDEFDSFWSLYPRRVGKKEARKAWDRMTVENRASALCVVGAHAALWEREGRGSTKIPHASTWLNRESWEDEISYTPDRQSGPRKNDGLNAVMGVLRQPETNDGSGAIRAALEAGES